MIADKSKVIETLRGLIVSAAALDELPAGSDEDDLDEVLRSIDSLGAMRLIIMIRETFKVEIEPMDLFLCENVGELSDAVAGTTPA